jgi:hypothetical protein
VTPQADGLVIVKAIDEVRAILATYVFHANDEADLQSQVAAVLETCGHFRISREVRVVEVRGRYDILVEVLGIGRGSPLHGIRLVLELKIGGTAEAAERQAQRYAQDKGVDAVVVVTSSQKLARWLMTAVEGGKVTLNELGGKPFAVIALRSV